jgi:aminoglycoside 6-adenylyltransferase
VSEPERSELILSKLVAWGASRDDLRAIAVVGSRARSDHPADRWSDLDVIVMVRRPKRYLDGSRWFAEIETPWLAVRQPTVVGGQQIFHITFEGGTKVDLVLVSSIAFSMAARAMETLRRHPSLLALLAKIARERLATLSDLLNRGFRFALDKDRIGDRLESGGLAVPPRRPPSQEEFLDLVERFLSEQVSFALKMRRGEFFVTKTFGEPRLMELLLQMIEWHTQVTSDRWSPVFEHGRFLEEWAPPFVIERLRGAFPRYDPADIWRARLASLDLFRLLAVETGARLGYAYPTKLEETVMTWVRDQARESEADHPSSGCS